MRNAVLVVVTSILLFSLTSEDGNAQVFRRIRETAAKQQKVSYAAPPLYFKPAGHVGYHVPQDYSAATVFPRESYFENRNPVISRILDGKMNYQNRHPVEVDSRYIGGFHQSHFDNIGVAPGDIGIRGNAFNWRTW